MRAAPIDRLLGSDCGALSERRPGELGSGVVGQRSGVAGTEEALAQRLSGGVRRAVAAAALQLGDDVVHEVLGGRCSA